MKIITVILLGAIILLPLHGQQKAKVIRIIDGNSITKNMVNTE